jgi:hypothetical protein
MFVRIAFEMVTALPARVGAFPKCDVVHIRGATHPQYSSAKGISKRVVMAHVRNLAFTMCGGLLLALVPMAHAATKVDEGFASQYELNGRFARPTNRISEGTMDQHAYYWIQWRDHPVGRTTFRCRVTHGESGAPVVDEEITYEDSSSEGFSLCGFTPSKARDREGAYTFTQYLDGAKVGESVLHVESRLLAQFKLMPWKLALIVFALAIAGLGWLGRKGLSNLGLKVR